MTKTEHPVHGSDDPDFAILVAVYSDLGIPAPSAEFYLTANEPQPPRAPQTRNS
jgi:hypothetical protein